MSNVVDVLIRGIDGVSPVVNGIKSNVLTGFGMGLGMKAVDGMLSGVSQLKGQLTEALSLQTQYIGAAASLNGMTGIGFGRSTEFLKGLRNELGKIAADLPGTTQDYLTFANSINGVLVKGYDVSDAVGLKTFQSDLIDITKRAQLLGQSRGAASEDTAYYIKQFISEGNTLKSLNPLAFDNRVPDFVLKVRDELKSMGKTEKDLNKMATGERARILRSVLGQLSSDEMISALQGTADSIVEGWKDKLFSQDRGVLGFMRAVQSRAGRTALDSFTELLNRINSLAGTAGKVLSQLGLTFDPMETVIDFISWLSNIVSTLEGAIVIAKNPGEIIPNIFREMGLALGSLLDNVASSFSSMDFSAMGNKLGDYLKALIQSVPWGKIGVTFGIVATQALIGLAGFLINPSMWMAAIKGVLQFLVGVLIGVVATLGKQTSRDWDNFLKGIVGWFKDMWTKVKDAFEPIASLIAKVVSTIVGIFNKIANFNPVASVSAAVAQSPIGQAVGGVVESVKASPIGQAVGGIINKVTGKDNTKPGDNKPTIPVAPGTTPLPQTSVTNNKQASNTFAPVVNVAMGTGDNIADKVIGALEQMYSQAQQGQMT